MIEQKKGGLGNDTVYVPKDNRRQQYAQGAFLFAWGKANVFPINLVDFIKIIFVALSGAPGLMPFPEGCPAIIVSGNADNWRE